MNSFRDSLNFNNICTSSTENSEYNQQYSNGYSTSTEQVVIHLIDLHKTTNASFEKLRINMAHSKPSRGFSLNFNLVHSLEYHSEKQDERRSSQPDASQPQPLLKNPFDVKISFSCSCVLVSEKDSKMIQLFDLTTRRFLSSINLPSIPRYMHIESDYDSSGNDALLFTSNDNSVYKYDLKTLIENKDSKYLWRNTEVKYPNGIVSRKFVDFINERRVERSYTFVCDGSSNCVRVLKTLNGQTFTSIGIQDRISMTSPWGIDFTSCGDMIITESLSHRIQILKRHLTRIGNSNQYQEIWKTSKIIGSRGSENGKMEYPSSIAFDSIHKRILVCDYANHRIQVFGEDGQHLKTFGKRGNGRSEFSFPNAICLCEKTGELLIVDSSNKRILTFI